MIDKKTLHESIKNNLFELFAKDFSYARNPEIYTALANSVRQLVGEKWFHSLYDNLDSRRLYILSFEYTLGDSLLKNLVKLNLYDTAKEILADYSIDIKDILEWDIEFALGYGDLGSVSGYLLEYLSKYHNNIYAYGLRYRNGMLKQEIIDGEQVEKPDNWRVNKNPWEHEKGFNHWVDLKDDTIKAIPYDIPILSSDSNNVSTLRLWKSYSVDDLNFEKFSKGQIQESYEKINRANSIVEFLYPSEDNYEGKKLRLEQEYFFASASIQDILKKYKKYIGEDISKLSDYITIQINDVHPSLSILVFIDLIMKKYEYKFEDALALAKEVFIFMQLSILPETMETWDLSLIDEVCPNLINIIYELDKHLKLDLANNNLDNPEPLLIIREGKLNSINVLYYVCKNIISLEKNHKNLLKDKYLSSQYNAYNSKFDFINFSFDTDQYYKERQVKRQDEVLAITDLEVNELKDIKLSNKKYLLNELGLDLNLYNCKSCFVMHLGNFHEYKRQILSVLSVALSYYRMKKNPNKDIPERTYFFAGKSYPNYYLAKEVIKFINALAKTVNNDLFIKDKIKIVFIENYNLSKADIAIPASDIYLNLEQLNMESDKISIYKSIASVSAILTSRGNFENTSFTDYGISMFKFGDKASELMSNYSYNVQEYLDNNSEIKEMFDFYKNLNKDEFPYDINKIKELILHYNDRNFIIKDLLDFTNELENAVRSYSYDKNWYKNLYSNAKKIIREDSSVKEYIELTEK